MISPILNISDKEILTFTFIFIMIILFSYGCAYKIKNKQIFENSFIKIIILSSLAYFAYNNNLQIAIVGIALYIMFEYKLLNDDIDIALTNTTELKNIEHFTNLIS